MLRHMFNLRRSQIVAVVGMLLTLFCFNLVAQAKQNSVKLLPHNDQLSVGPVFIETDDDKKLTALQFYNRLLSRTIQNTTSIPFNKGLTATRYWLGFNIANNSQTEVTLQLATGAYYRPLLSIKLFDENGHQQQLLTEHHSISFSERYSQFRQLNTRPFALNPLHKVTLIIEYETIGSSYLPLMLGSSQFITHFLSEDATNSAFFYSFCLAALLMFAIFGIAMSDKTIVLYCMLFLFGLLTIASMEGFAFKFLWPNYPLWNHYSPLILLYLLSASGLWLAWFSKQADKKTHPIRTVILSSSIISGLLAPCVFWFDFIFMAQLVSIFMIAMFFSHVYSMWGWLTLNQTSNQVAKFSAVAVAITVTLFILLSLVSSDSSLLPELFYIQSTRVIYILIMLATIIALTTHVRTLHKNHEQALKDALSAAQRESLINRQLFEAEQNFTQAKQLASLRRQQLASASHDIKQPLVSLRSTVDSLLHNQPEQTRNQLLNAFNYLDSLCTQYLNQTLPDDEEAATAPIETEPTTTQTEVEVQPYSVNLILETAERMFLDEAAGKHIKLQHCNCSVEITTSPVILMRLYSNLVSNAVKHTAQGRILLGVRRQPNAIRLLVLDTGVGIAEDRLSHVMQAYNKGPDSEGTGLGLAICQQLAFENQLGFDIFSQPGKGTVCQITIPL